MVINRRIPPRKGRQSIDPDETVTEVAPTEESADKYSTKDDSVRYRNIVEVVAIGEDESSSPKTGTPQATPLSPSPFSPIDEQNNDKDIDNNLSALARSGVTAGTPRSHRGYSRLFSPYRTLGLVADGPFYLLPNQDSSNAMVCAAIGERFHLVQCDKLQPVLVSHAVPGPENVDSSIQQNTPQKIFHVISDNSLSVCVVAHGPHQHSHAKYVTLFHRTQPLTTLGDICLKESSIVSLLHLGKIKSSMTGEKQDLQENAALVAVILSRGKDYDVEGEGDDGVPVHGSDQEEADAMGIYHNDSNENEDSSSDEGDGSGNIAKGSHQCEVVLLVATRTCLTVRKRIPLDSFATFSPKVGIHPPTYVNKIVLGGSCAKTKRDALVLLNIRTGKTLHVYRCLTRESNKANSEITSLENSPAIDTIAVGNSKGVVHLINIRYDRLLFSLRHFSKSGKGLPRITSMSFRNDGSALKYEIAPLAVGRSDGTISIWDLSPPDEDPEDYADTLACTGRTLLCEMIGVHRPGGVHKLQYMPQEPLLISTGNRSNALIMHVFDNPDHSGRILRQRNGHTSPPKCIRYLHPGAGAGGGMLANMADGTDAQSCQILSGGADHTLRRFSTVRSVLDKEFSQGQGLEKKAKELGMKDKTDLLLPTISAMATSETRNRDWGDLVTIHKHHPYAYVWSSRTGSQSGPILRQDDWHVSAMKRQPPKSTHATSVCISTCGNFALVGSQGGTIYKYNIQSGVARGTYPPNENHNHKPIAGKDVGDIRRTFKTLEKKMNLSNRGSNAEKQKLDRIEAAKREERRKVKLRIASHSGYAVTGIAVDSVNRTVLSVGEDAKLILWSFTMHTPHKKSPSKLPSPAAKLCHVKDSDLAAIALQDYSILLFACATLSIVRRFGTCDATTRHRGPITDIGFSPDGRTLYTASLDSSIRVWDVPTSSCVDWLGFSSAPTSLTVSPTGEYLATSHSGSRGISLWSDRSFYQMVHVCGDSTPVSPALMDDPAPIAEVESNNRGEEVNDDAEENLLMSFGVKSVKDETAVRGPAKSKEEGLVTLSGLPPAHWKNLFHLELVKQRNKPKEPPKKPPTAPFFLQWRPGLDPVGEPIGNWGVADRKNVRQDENDWDAVWSDDENEENNGVVPGLPPVPYMKKRSREDVQGNGSVGSTKREKVYHRSQLASLLEECAQGEAENETKRFDRVTAYVGTLGPSAIDVSLSSLCGGIHDLEEGLRLLIYASRWLIEACQSRERFDAVNAYLHRFLYLHSTVLAGIDSVGMPGESANDVPDNLIHQREELLLYIAQLKTSQRRAFDSVQGEMQNTLCLLRHFSRMV